jgi:hypothetical protein
MYFGCSRYDVEQRTKAQCLVVDKSKLQDEPLGVILPIPGEAKAKAMPGWLYIHTK